MVMFVINKGDFIFEDLSGVVIILSDLVDEILVKTEDIVKVENILRLKLKNGVNPIKVFSKYGKF